MLLTVYLKGFKIMSIKNILDKRGELMKIEIGLTSFADNSEFSPIKVKHLQLAMLRE